jgi:type IV pilus assembly protein PilW
MNASHLRHGRKARGFTLAEFMVAMTISLIVLAALSSIYVSSGQSFRANDNFARIQENSRIAFDLMSRDLRQTGYSGCIGSSTQLTNVLNSSTNLIWDYTRPIYGYESTSSGWNLTLDPTISGPAPIIGENHDILVVHSLDDGGGVVTAQASATDPLTITGQSGISVGDVLMTSDCSTTVVFQASSVTTSGASDIIAHAAATGSTPGNSTTNLGFTFKNKELRRVSTKSYYIGTGANNIPALFVRRSNETTSQELVEGVDGMSITYGLDSDANYATDNYQTADNVTDWTKVMSVKITLTAISPENYIATATQSNAAGTATDRRQRQQMTMTISLRNRTG